MGAYGGDERSCREGMIRKRSLVLVAVFVPVRVSGTTGILFRQVCG